MKWYWYVVCVTVLIAGLLFVPNIIDNKVTEDEIWWESYQINDGSYIRIIHAHDCQAKKPCIAWNIQCKMLDYYKQKIDVYDYCINEDEAIMLNYISMRNIKHALERQWAYAEDENDYKICRWNEKIWDTTLRVREVAYSMNNGDLVPQNDDGMIITDFSWNTQFGNGDNK